MRFFRLAVVVWLAFFALDEHPGGPTAGAFRHPPDTPPDAH